MKCERCHLNDAKAEFLANVRGKTVSFVRGKTASVLLCSQQLCCECTSQIANMLLPEQPPERPITPALIERMIK